MPRFRSLPLRALLPVVFVLLAAMWLGVGVVVMPADQPRWLASTTGLVWLVVSLFFVVALISSTIGARRRSVRLTRMLSELRSRE